MIGKYFFSVLTVLGISIVGLTQTRQAIETTASLEGQWVICNDANKLLGFTSDNPREGSAFSQYPSSFRLTYQQASKKQIADRIKAYIGENVFKSDSIELIQWDSDFHQAEEWETTSFLVRNQGKTSLYSSVPYAVIYGGEISLINGADNSKDLLVINFNPSGKERTPDTVAYKRKPEGK